MTARTEFTAYDWPTARRRLRAAAVLMLRRNHVPYGDTYAIRAGEPCVAVVNVRDSNGRYRNGATGVDRIHVPLAGDPPEPLAAWFAGSDAWVAS